MVAGAGSAPLPRPTSGSGSDAPPAVSALPYSRRELFSDDRGRGLRASWHPEQGVVVLSRWKGDVCAGTVRLDHEDARRLAGFLDVQPHADTSGDGDAQAPGVDETVPLRVLRDE